MLEYEGVAKLKSKFAFYYELFEEFVNRETKNNTLSFYYRIDLLFHFY